jgi:hypothetical protein
VTQVQVASVTIGSLFILGAFASTRSSCGIIPARRGDSDSAPNVVSRIVLFALGRFLTWAAATGRIR